jgi:hypothetical protein
MATTKTEEIKANEAMTVKQFKQTSDIDNFYRFIHENNLRHEAKVLMTMVAKTLKKSSRKRKSKTLN